MEKVWVNEKQIGRVGLYENRRMTHTLVLPVCAVCRIMTDPRARISRDYIYIIHSFDLFNTVELILLGPFCR